MTSLFRVNMLKNGKWEMWTNYATYDEAELAATGLVQQGTAKECHILEITNNGGRIVALVEKANSPHSKAVVKKLPHTINSQQKENS